MLEKITLGSVGVSVLVSLVGGCGLIGLIVGGSMAVVVGLLLTSCYSR